MRTYHTKFYFTKWTHLQMLPDVCKGQDFRQSQQGTIHSKTNYSTVRDISRHPHSSTAQKVCTCEFIRKREISLLKAIKLMLCWRGGRYPMIASMRCFSWTLSRIFCACFLQELITKSVIVMGSVSPLAPRTSYSSAMSALFSSTHARTL